MIKIELNNKDEIRKSNIKDINAVNFIIKNVLLSNIKNDEEGFLINFPDKREYEYRLKHNKFNQILQINKKTVGFLIAFTSEELKDNLSKGFLGYQNTFFKSLFKLNRKFVWLDQIAVFPKEYRNKNYGSLMLKNVITNASLNGYNDFYGSLSVCPNFNLISFNFIKSHKFNIVETVNYKNRKWGIFYGKF